MKRLLFAILIACAIAPIQSSCSSPPSIHVAAGKSLEAVGQSTEAAVAESAHLYARGDITAAQARQVNNFYDTKFQPTFRLAVAAVKADLSQPASPEVTSLASQLLALIASFKKP